MCVFLREVSNGKQILEEAHVFFLQCSEVSFLSNCRIFNISSGKQKKLFKGSLSEDGSLLRVTFPSTVLTPTRFHFLYIQSVD